MTFADFLFQATFYQWSGLLILAVIISSARPIVIKHVKPDKGKNQTP